MLGESHRDQKSRGSRVADGRHQIVEGRSWVNQLGTNALVHEPQVQNPNPQRMSVAFSVHQQNLRSVRHRNVSRQGASDFGDNRLEHVFAESSKTVLFRNRDDRLLPVLPDLVQHWRDDSQQNIDWPNIGFDGISFNYLGCLEVAISSSLSEP